MTTNALKQLALMAELPSMRAEHVDIETMWGWHYLIETDGQGKRLRLRGRCSLDGQVPQHFPSEFSLSETQARFAPTADELGL
jgi:hypothetical protein